MCSAIGGLVKSVEGKREQPQYNVFFDEQKTAYEIA